MAQRNAEAPPDVEHDFDAWASVSAQLLLRTDAERRTLVQQFGIDRAWTAADGAWSKALSADILEGRLERLNHYGEICAGVFAVLLLPEDADGEPPEARLDFGAVRQSLQAAEEAAGWSVERYAHFCAELELHPDRTDAVWAAHGLGWLEVRHHVVSAWTERLEADAELKTRWTELVAKYLAAGQLTRE